MSPLHESCAAGVERCWGDAGGGRCGSADALPCRAIAETFPSPSPPILSVDAQLPLGFRASLPSRQLLPCAGHCCPSQTGGLWLSGAGAGAGGTKVFLLVVVMEMMLPAAAGSLQRR